MGFLSGQKVLEEVTSAINGKVRVVKSLALGTYIQVEGLTQSGGVVYGVWKSTLSKAKRRKPEVLNCLILGLGGGSAATLIKKYWPRAQVVGVDIDPLIVKMGRKYLGLKDLKVIFSDAADFLKKSKKKFDLILIDTYIGYEFPKKFEGESFLKNVKKSLVPFGIAVFNRLYMADRRAMAVRFGEKLDNVFKKVERVYPEANVMFLCYN